MSIDLNMYCNVQSENKTVRHMAWRVSFSKLKQPIWKIWTFEKTFSRPPSKGTWNNIWAQRIRFLCKLTWTLLTLDGTAYSEVWISALAWEVSHSEHSVLPLIPVKTNVFFKCYTLRLIEQYFHWYYPF